MLAAWDRQNEGHALKDLERRLVIAVRTWRPHVVLAESPDPTATADPSGALVSQVLERAFQSAADATAFPELIESAGLTPWSVSKLFVAARDPASGDNYTIDSSEISHTADWAGRPLDDQASLAMSLLAESYCSTAIQLSFSSVASRLPANKDDELMAGIVLEPGGPARRRLPAPIEISDAQRLAVQARRNLLAIMTRAQSQPILAQQMNAQVGGLLRDLPSDQAGNLLYNLARTHFSQGRWTDTRDLLEKLLAENSGHLTAAEAQRWLIQFYASSEARHRERVASVAGQRIINPQAPTQADARGDRTRTTPNVASGQSPATARMAIDQQAGMVGGLMSGIPWARGAVDTAKSLMQNAPLVWSEPQVQFAVAAAQRTLGNVKDADKFYTTFAFGRNAGAWSDAARSERWIRDRQEMPPKPVLISQRTTTPPRLDGSLDDALWKGTSVIALHSVEQPSVDGLQTQVRMAHDQQFLYVAIACASPDAVAMSPVRPRSRDMDLSAHDRVDLYFDLDRDYCTYYHLAADNRGCVFEDCWGDRTWDPTWYVASQADEHGYHIEAAIPLAELTDGAPTDGTVWAFNAVRIIPGQRVMSWSRPAGISPRPEGMGLLIFSDGPTSPPPRPAIAN
jgi:hypothetical protein